MTHQYDIETSNLTTEFIAAESYEIKNPLNSLLNILHLKIRSINKNVDELFILLNILGSSIDIIILSETWTIAEDLDHRDCVDERYFMAQLNKWLQNSHPTDITTIFNILKN